MPDTQPTREQQRAMHALRMVKKVKDRKAAGGKTDSAADLPADSTEKVRDKKVAEGKFAKDYKSYAESLPATIVANGLGQACATLLAQAKGTHDAHRELYDHLEDWLCERNAAVYNRKPLVEAIINGNQDQYVLAQFEALAYLTWLKKFAQAELSKGKGDIDGKK